MTTEALASVIILTSALLHAVVNAMIKVSDDGLLTRGCMNATALVCAAPFTILIPVPSVELWRILFLAMLVHGLYPFFLVAAYRHGDLSAMFPVARGIAPIGVAGLSFVFSGQGIGVWQAVSIGLISIGVASFALERTVWTERNAKKGLAFAGATGIIIACYTTIDGIGLRLADSPLTFIVWFFVLDGVFVTFAVIVARRSIIVSFLRWHWKEGLAAGILGVLTYGLALYALALGAVVEIAALRETSVVFAALIGAIVLREPFGLRRIAASIVVAAGIIIMHATK